MSNLYRGLVVGRRRTHALLDLASHGQESLLDVAGVLGRGLEEWDAQAVGEFLQRDVSISIVRLCLTRALRWSRQLQVPSHLCDRVVHDLLIRHIALVAYE